MVGWNTCLLSQAYQSSAQEQQKVTVFDNKVEFSGWPGNNNTDSIKVDEVRIGFFFPVHPENKVNASINNAADLAIAEINKRGGYNTLPFRLVKRWADDPWGAGSKEMIRLVYEDSVWAVIGSLDGTATHVAEQIATKAWLPLISPLSADPTLNYIRIPWIFRLAPGYDEQAKIIVTKGIKEHALNNVGLITTTDHDGRIFAEEVRTALEAIDQALLFHFQVPAQQENLADVVQRAFTFNPDALILFLTEQQIENTISGLHNESTVPLFIPWIAGLNTEVLSQKDAENLFIINSFSQIHNPVWESFRDTYYARFGTIPSAAAAFTYDAIYLVASAIQKAGLNRPAIREAIVHTNYHRPVTGKISWDNTGGNRMHSMLLQRLSGN
jgi:branched-chain amino acid transport system substrate-binding protein